MFVSEVSKSVWAKASDSTSGLAGEIRSLEGKGMGSHTTQMEKVTV